MNLNHIILDFRTVSGAYPDGDGRVTRERKTRTENARRHNEERRFVLVLKNNEEIEIRSTAGVIIAIVSSPLNISRLGRVSEAPSAAKIPVGKAQNCGGGRGTVSNGRWKKKGPAQTTNNPKLYTVTLNNDSTSESHYSLLLYLQYIEEILEV